jgi:serine/threonine protein kinase
MSYIKEIRNCFFFIYFIEFITFEVEMIEKIGKGGQGNVYSVIDQNTKEKYALKRIPIKKEESKGRIKEMEILQNEKLHHINIVRYFTCFIEGETMNIIMELCEEGNLEDFIKKFKNMIPEEVLFYFLFIFYIHIILHTYINKHILYYNYIFTTGNIKSSIADSEWIRYNSQEWLYSPRY